MGRSRSIRKGGSDRGSLGASGTLRPLLASLVFFSSSVGALPGCTDEPPPAEPGNALTGCSEATSASASGGHEGTATVRGQVHLDAPDPFRQRGDGQGTLFVAIFANNPASTVEAPIARRHYPDVDLSSPGLTVEYELADIPLRVESYHLSAFLDDDESSSTVAPRPSPGDTIAIASLTRRTVPTIQLCSAGTYQKDLALDFVAFTP